MRLTVWDCDRCGCACTFATEGDEEPDRCPLWQDPLWVRRGEE